MLKARLSVSRFPDQVIQVIYAIYSYTITRAILLVQANMTRHSEVHVYRAVRCIDSLNFVYFYLFTKTHNLARFSDRGLAHLRPNININLQGWAKSGIQLFTYQQLTVYCTYFFTPLYSPYTSKPHPCLGLRPRSPAMLMVPQIDVYLRYLFFPHNIFIKRRNWIGPSMMVLDKVHYWTSIMIFPRRVRTSVAVRCTSVELLEL